MPHEAAEGRKVLRPRELDSRTERCLADFSEPERYNARQVRAQAAEIVRRHATRLGLDGFATSAIVNRIEAIPAEHDA